MPTIPRRLSHCSLGRESFEPGCEYLSFLDYEGNRKDFCLSCWDKMQRPIKGYFWKGVIPKKKEKILHPDHQALILFKTMDHPKLRFLLALYLQRKHQLIRRTETFYEIPTTGEVFNIEKETLSQEEGVILAQQLDHMIHDAAPVS